MSYQTFQNLCAKKGVSPNQVSKETGVATATLTNWKQGKYTPKREKMEKLASYFNVSTEYLITGQSTEKESTSGEKYYFDDSTAETAQMLFENPSLRILFDAARDSSPADLQLAADLLRRLKGEGIDE